jgi:hypothetical protein
MKIKKIALSLAGMAAAVAFAPDASAIPAFARQVGMACSACHYQHFPVLNSFGRAFKAGGYTMIGAQEKIEGEGVSLPVVLNAALVGYIGYQKTNGQTVPGALPGTKTTNDGSLSIPQQVSLFLGGRAGEHVGFEAEINMANAGTIPTAGSAGIIRLKVPFVFDVGSVHAGIIPFSTGLGAADSFEVLNTGAVAVHAFNQSDMPAVSAQQYIGTATPAAGVAFIASNDDFFANFAKWGANQGGGASGAPTSNYLRGAWTTGLIPGFDSAIGFQSWSGTSAEDTPTVNLVNGIVDTKAWAIDAQTMGDVAGMPLLVTASYAKASATNATDLAAGTNVNLFNTNAMDKKSFNIGAELGVIPNKATVQLAFRHASSGQDAGVVAGGAATGSNASDNAVMIGATYALALNARFEATYSKYSGDMYGDAVQAANPGTYLGDNMLMLDLAFGF